MPRPKQDLTKESRIDVRMHPQLRAALETLAHHESRTLSQLCERALRAYAIDALKRLKQPTDDIDSLP